MNLFNGDCLEEMKRIEDKSVDLVICDLPYGCLNGNKGECKWDVKINLEKFWTEVKRIRKDDHTPTIHFCNTKYGYELIKSNEDEFRYDLVWDKTRGVSFLQANKMPMRSHEMIYLFSKKSAFYNRIDITGNYPNTHRGKGTNPTNVYNVIPTFKSTTSTTERCAVSIIQQSRITKKGQHPTAKPIELYKFLIERYCPIGGTVLDPTFGSGNSGRACRELNRKYIGMEMNKKFFDTFNLENIASDPNKIDDEKN